MDSTPPKRHKSLQKPSAVAETLAADDDNDTTEDRISNLPDSILSHILSKLPTKNAVATTVLSTKWKHLFAAIPNLTLDIDDAVSSPVSHQPNPNFVNFMYHLLTVTLRDVPSIREFALRCNQDHGNSHIDAWISAVLGLKASVLSLFFPKKNTGVSIESIFQCETLVHLLLSQHFFANVPETVYLPNLKRLYLDFVKFPDHSFQGIIRGCPMLEALSLDSCEFEDAFIVSICSQSLKFLNIYNCKHDHIYQLVINTPSLEILFYDDHVADSYWGVNLNSLLKARINVGPSDYQSDMADDEESQEYDEYVAQLVAACYNVDYLYLSTSTVAAIHRSYCEMPTLHNLTELILDSVSSHGWEFLPLFLETAPNLEILVFMGGFLEHEGFFTKFKSFLPNSVPTCLLLHLRSLYFEEFNGEEDELELVKYFLTTGEVLREMKFIFRSTLPIEKQFSTWSKLILLGRSSKSKYCKIYFTDEDNTNVLNFWKMGEIQKLEGDYKSNSNNH